MRSQLDCHDDRLPGTGVFDVKTRACLPIRLDILNFEVSISDGGFESNSRLIGTLRLPNSKATWINGKFREGVLRPYSLGFSEIQVRFGTREYCYR